MHCYHRSAYVALFVLVSCAPSLLAQQYCASGAVLTATGTSFKVGDPVAFTATVTPSSLSCTTFSPVAGLTDTTCSAEFTLDIASGTRYWQSSVSVPNSFSASGSSAPSISSNSSSIHLLEGAGISPLSAGSDVTLALDFEVSYSTLNVIAGGVLPTSLPSSATSFLFKLLDASAAQYTVSYTGQTCAVASTSGPSITFVQNAESGAATIAPNTWVTLKGSNLASAGDSRIWAASDFGANGQLPTSLDGVSVTVNGVAAYIYYISPTQVNVLTAPGALPGSVNVMLTYGTTSAPFSVQAQAESPSFFVFNGGPYIAATHLNGSLIGPTSLYPGYSTPAAPGETIVLYANGFGATSVPVVAGAETQSGTLTPLPVVTVGGVNAIVLFAGLVAPGEFQFNIVLPSSLSSADQPTTATYNGLTTQAGTLITVQ